jgi:hypothetical protein
VGVGVALSAYALKLPTMRIDEGSKRPCWAETVKDNTGKPFLKDTTPSDGTESGLISIYLEVLIFILFYIFKYEGANK